MAATQSETRSFKLGYRPELDGIRAIAIVSVLGGHSTLIGSGADLMGPKLATGALGFHGGVFGVDIFFVLSGFLITTLLLQEYASWRQIDFKAFYIRRILRLSPAMLMTLAGCAVYLLLSGGHSGNFDWWAILYSALYVSNFALIFGGLILGMLTPTWSLSVEEQFYSIWPLIMSRLVTASRASVVKFILIAIVFTLGLRAVLHAAFWHFYAWPLFGAANHLIFARADGLLCGAMVAFVAHWGWLPDPGRYATQIKATGWFCALTLLAILHYGPGIQESGLYGASIFYFFYAYVSVATALFIAVLLSAPPAPLLALLRWRPMVWIGKISYGLYLYHMPIFVLTPVALLGQIGSVAFAVPLAFAVAALSFFGIEKRFLNLRETLGLPRAARLAKLAQREARVLQDQHAS